MARPNRWEYLNDYKKNENGEYVYSGGYYFFAGSEKDRKNAYIKLWLMLAVILASSVGSGCINAAGMNNSFYVIFPFIAEIASLFVLVWNSVKLLSKGDKIKAYVYKPAHMRIPASSVLLSFFSVAGFLCSLVFVILNGFEGGIINCIAYLALKLFTFAFSLIFRNYFIKLEWLEL